VGSLSRGWLVLHWNRRGSYAHPRAIPIYPRIDESITPNIGFAILNSLFVKDTCRNCHIAENVHGDRLGLRLLLVGGLRRVDACQKYSLGLEAAVIIDQHYGVVEDFTQRFFVAKLIGLIPGFLHCDDLGFNGTIVLSHDRRGQRTYYTNNAEQLHLYLALGF
jgi:hypothetical protein